MPQAGVRARRAPALKLVTLLAAGLAMAAVFASAAGAHSSDAWLTTRTSAASKLHDRFDNIASVACAPDRSSPSQIFGTTRYWQRFWCAGQTHDRVAFRLRFVTTGQCSACWTSSNLRGDGVNHLRVRHVVPKTKPAPTSCGSDSYINSRGHCVPRPSSDPGLTPAGPTAICGDGTYSYSESASGTCSHHGGVATWLHHP
jgi:hypothetical protein